MVFKCQEDSFLREFKAKIESSQPATHQKEDKLLEGYNVILNNTILFPEGGGQPCDFGYINEYPVWNVTRKLDKAIHFVESKTPFNVGEEVQIQLDWNRRLEHMQQHSGQHLISALFEKNYGNITKSWWLGEKTTYIELDAIVITNEKLSAIQNEANELIFTGKTVSVYYISMNEYESLGLMHSTSSLPDDHVSDVRIISIEGIDRNMCCGTHVTNLSQLQLIKILGSEKKKKSIIVHFLVGIRALKKFNECIDRENNFNKILRSNPNDHIQLVEKLQRNLKSYQKSLNKVLNEIAISEAEKLKNLVKLPIYYSLHRREGVSIDFINTFLRNAPPQVCYFLTVGDEIGNGHMILRGRKDVITEIAPHFLELLDGKGNWTKDTFQAKINSLTNIPKCEEILRKTFDQLID